MNVAEILISGGVGLVVGLGSGYVLSRIGVRDQAKLQDRDFKRRAEESAKERQRQAVEAFKLAVERLVNTITEYEMDADNEKWEVFDTRLREVLDGWLTFPDSYKKGDLLREFAILDRMSSLAREAKNTLPEDKLPLFWRVFQEARWAAHSLRDSLLYAEDEADVVP